VTQNQSDVPPGTPYDWYVQAVHLLENGSSEAAADFFARVLKVDPTSACVLEGHARALFDSRPG
jgi:hypothetical protein